MYRSKSHRFLKTFGLHASWEDKSRGRRLEQRVDPRRLFGTEKGCSWRGRFDGTATLVKDHSPPIGLTRRSLPRSMKCTRGY